MPAHTARVIRHPRAKGRRRPFAGEKEKPTVTVDGEGDTHVHCPTPKRKWKGLLVGGFLTAVGGIAAYAAWSKFKEKNGQKAVLPPGHQKVEALVAANPSPAQSFVESMPAMGIRPPSKREDELVHRLYSDLQRNQESQMAAMQAQVSDLKNMLDAKQQTPAPASAQAPKAFDAEAFLREHTEE